MFRWGNRATGFNLNYNELALKLAFIILIKLDSVFPKSLMLIKSSYYKFIFIFLARMISVSFYSLVSRVNYIQAFIRISLTKYSYALKV